MIRTYSTTIRRREMDAVLTCMVDERIGPGELNGRFVQSVKEFFGCDGAVALRSPKDALKYALRAIDFTAGECIMISALAPSWQIIAVEDLGYKPLVLDVEESTGLVNADIIREGIKNGGRLLLLDETMGVLPEMQSILDLNIPIIEDVSKSAGAEIPLFDGNENLSSFKKAGSYGVYSILGLEENDVITSGGGAVLFAPNRREWIVLKKIVDSIAKTDLLPDINCALGWVQIKEFKKNETVRKGIFSLYQRACLSGRHKMFVRTAYSNMTKENVSQAETSAPADNYELENSSTMCCFPLILAGSFKDIKSYSAKKDIEIVQLFENSVLALREEELSASCVKAKSIYLRCAAFPLYPRLTHSQVAKIVKVLGSLP